MKPSLEEERSALLAQIEASRAVYRRMLSSETTRHARKPLPTGTTSSLHSTSFPRSRTMGWLIRHPVAVAAGVALLVWAAPRWWSARSDRQRRQAVSATYPVPQERRQPTAPTEGIARALITSAALLLRNPATMKALGRIAGMGWQWMQHRGERSPDRSRSRSIQ